MRASGLRIVAVLRQFPRGRTTAELARQLDIEFDSLARRSLSRELADLASARTVRLSPARRWVLSSTPQREPSGALGRDRHAPTSDSHHLQATWATFHRGEPLDRDLDDVAERAAANADTAALLRYYASALRSDPRGDTRTTPDRHGEQFLLVHGIGAWWPLEGSGGRISIQSGTMPGPFREALFKRGMEGGPLAIGWPLCIARDQGVETVLPVGLLAAEWNVEDDRHVVRVALDGVAANPSFIKTAGSVSNLSRSTAAEVLSQDGQPLPLQEFRYRIENALASRSHGRLDPSTPRETVNVGEEGVWNAMALFLPTDSTFTLGAARDLDAIATWPSARSARTALAAPLGLSSSLPADVDTAVLDAGQLNSEQLDAARSGLRNALTVVTGPPGTGKSQVIVTVVASAISAGESVLVASKNHQALDAIEERLAPLAGDAPLLVRTLDPRDGRDTDVAAVLDALGQITAERDVASDVDPDREVERLRELDRRRERALDAQKRENVVRARIADHIERLAAIEADVIPLGGDLRTTSLAGIGRSGWLQRFLTWLRSGRAPVSAQEEAALPVGASAGALRAAIERDRAELGSLSAGHRDDAGELTALLRQGFMAIARAVFVRRLRVAEDIRNGFADEAADRVLSGQKSWDRGLLARILQVRPVWLASVLGTPRRIPLADGMFDLVIFDEAGQCDIASALPLLARAKRAMIVGDPRQLSFIPGLGVAQERNLMRAQGLSLRGMGRYMQSRRSLFDLAADSAGATSILLREQFRSAPAIVDYISEDFYGGALRPGRGNEDFTSVGSLKPGLHWTDVRGRLAPAPEEGVCNRSEVEAIAAYLADLVQTGFAGSVGVIAPFNAQVRALQQEIANHVPGDARERFDLRIATVDRFQGQERDLIVFSATLCEASAASSVSFVQRDWRRVNVAISRARAVAHVFGDLDFARSGRVSALQRLAARATEPKRRAQSGGTFDSEWERRLDAAMRARGLDAQPQYPIAGRWLDFALISGDTKIDIEVDGRRWHTDADGNRKVADVFRDAQLRALGWKVVRFWVDELNRDMEGCVDRIIKEIGRDG